MTQPDFRHLCAELVRGWDDLSLHDAGALGTFVEDVRALLAVPLHGRSLAEISSWVLKCGQDAANNKWLDHVEHHDAVAIAAAALHDLGHASWSPVAGWQPIDTAPKETLLLARRDNQITIAAWLPSKKKNEQVEGDVDGPAGVWVNDIGKDFCPTQWHPLPAEP